MAKTNDPTKPPQEGDVHLSSAETVKSASLRKRYTPPKLTVYGSKEDLRKLGKESLVDLFVAQDS